MTSPSVTGTSATGSSTTGSSTTGSSTTGSSTTGSSTTGPSTTGPSTTGEVPRGDLENRLGLTVAEAGPRRVVGSLPVAGNTQPFGVLHGGASCVLAETLASVGACLHFAADGGTAVGTEINATHHRPATAGLVRGVATAVHLGRGHATYEVVITDERGKRVCTARMTCVRVPA
ncbi:hotdog fold thioesterase [Saccharothrix syringae]|uniref:hotdog fold thioesterase n=1 Tax=Saccharothrix syringae TaxID=103733 RepID=UPI000A03CC4D|nr:hotdog fold thioesterase [Saccharothrix syringae]